MRVVIKVGTSLIAPGGQININLLRGMVDPASPWIRARQVPQPILEVMEVLCAYAQLYPEVRRRGRAV